MTRKAEHFEESISAWLDGAADREQSVQMLDHLVRCAACRTFYREARALEGVIAARDESGATPAPTDLWEEIGLATGGRRRRRVWALRVAALVVVALGLGFALLPRSTSLSSIERPAEITVELGSRSGLMTEERFFQITAEVLEADRRYQQAMHEVMDQVLEGRREGEGGRDGRNAGDESLGERERSGGRA